MKVEDIPLTQIDPPAAEDLVRPVAGSIVDEMRLSIENDGLYSPLIVRPKGDGRFEVVAGNHRYAAIVKKWTETRDAKTVPPLVPCVVREISKEEGRLVSIAENIQRNTHLDPLREGEIFAELLKKGWTVSKVQERIGKKRVDYVTNRILIHEKLHDALKMKARYGHLSIRVAVFLAGLPLKQQLSTYREILKAHKRIDDDDAEKPECTGKCPRHCPKGA